MDGPKGFSQPNPQTDMKCCFVNVNLSLSPLQLQCSCGICNDGTWSITNSCVSNPKGGFHPAHCTDLLLSIHCRESLPTLAQIYADSQHIVHDGYALLQTNIIRKNLSCPYLDLCRQSRCFARWLGLADADSLDFSKFKALDALLPYLAFARQIDT